MKQRVLGSAGTQVSCMGLGTMPLAIEKRPTETEAVRVIHRALDLGVDWLDTADAYCLNETEVGYGERLVARALSAWSGARDSIRVASKAGFVRPSGEWLIDARPERLRTACEASLRALDVDSIFLYQLHAPDPSVYFPDSVGALADLQREGKIQHIGLSNVEVPHIRAARQITEIVSVQNRANIFDRHCFVNGTVEYCERERIAFIAHSPVGGHRGYVRVANEPTLGGVSARHAASPFQMAIAWLLDQSPAVLVIPGASRVASLESSVAAAELELTDEDRLSLSRAFPSVPFVVKQLVQVRREARHLARTIKGRALSALSALRKQ